MTWNMIGAAFAAAAPGIPSWSIGYQDGNDMGGLLAAILEPAGGFGKFLLVLIAVSVSSACALSIYSIGECTAIHRFRPFFMVVLSLFFIFLFFTPFLVNCFMAITPVFGRVPRYVYTFISTVM